eukprot:jgi/Pico_ML_1/52052/g2822.t1
MALARSSDSQDGALSRVGASIQAASLPSRRFLTMDGCAWSSPSRSEGRAASIRTVPPSVEASLSHTSVSLSSADAKAMAVSKGPATKPTPAREKKLPSRKAVALSARSTPGRGDGGGTHDVRGVLAEYLKERRHLRIVDFDDHLDDPSKDWLNPEITA